MLRSIWLVARREYIGYVSAIGFWIGLLLTPIAMAIGIIAPSLIKDQPIRYYAIIDSSEELQKALDWQLETWQSGQTLSMINQAIASYPPTEKRRIINAYENARAEGKSPENALKELNIDLPLVVPDLEFLKVKLTSNQIKNVEQLLISGEKLDGPKGAHPLFAAIVVERDQVGDIVAVDYISPDVVNTDLKAATTGALRYMSRLDLFEKAGVTPQEIRKADASIPDVFVKKPGAKKTGPADTGVNEVTLTDHAPYIAAAFIAFGLWLLIFSVVNFLLTGTIEERSNKIFDTLLTSVKLSDLLAGKLLGVLMLSATLLGGWVLMGLWAALNAGDIFSPAVLEFAQSALNPSLILPAFAGFIAGYLMYGAIFLALGALCDTIQEAQTLATPLIIMLMIPLFMVAIALKNPASSIVMTASWIPFFTPFLMILRAPLEPPLWEVILHLVVMLVSTWFAVHVSIKVYRTGAVHGTGLKDIMHSAKSLFRKVR